MCKEKSDCTLCDFCTVHPYVEYDSCYYKCTILNRIVGDEGHPGYDGFPPEIPEDCPKEIEDF
jgi:hypothetical protein